MHIYKDSKISRYKEINAADLVEEEVGANDFLLSVD